MKKVLCLVLCFILALSLVACGKDDKKDTQSIANKVDANTIEIVNNAFAATKQALASATALGYSGTAVKTATVDNTSTSFRMSVSLNYKTAESGRVFGCEIITKSGDTSETVQLYSDAANVYGNKAGTTYILSKNKDTDDFVQNLFNDIEFMDATNINVINTQIVDTNDGGHGFVLDYDFNDTDFNPEETIGTDFFSEKAEGMAVTITGLRVSGIVDTNGRLTTQRITLTYTYPIEVEEIIADADPDNSGVTETTQKVTKTVSNEISFEFKFNYDLAEVKVPDKITLPKTEGDTSSEDGETDEEEDKPVKLTEISISDFNKLTSKEEDKK